MGRARNLPQPLSMQAVPVQNPNALPPWSVQLEGSSQEIPPPKFTFAALLCFVMAFKIIILFISFLGPTAWEAVSWERSEHALPLQKYFC